MSALSEALQKYEDLQAARIAEEAKLSGLVSTQGAVTAGFNAGAVLTVGPTLLPKPVADLLAQMRGQLASANDAVSAQVVVVQGAYKAEQDAQLALQNLLRGSLNVGATSIT